jgi:hypothetical protein
LPFAYVVNDDALVPLSSEEETEDARERRDAAHVTLFGRCAHFDPEPLI